MVQLSGLKEGGQAEAAKGNMMIGLVSVLLACCSSGFAGVYFEKVLKGSEVSVWVRNVELALIGIFVGLAGVYYSDAEKVREFGFFHGYSPVVWGVISLQALGGIVVAIVVKYADNLLKGFATSISIVISCLVSYAFFGEITLSPKFVMGTFLVIFSTIMYSTNPLELLHLLLRSGSSLSGGLTSAGSNGSRLPYTSSSSGNKHSDSMDENIPLTEIVNGGGDGEAGAEGGGGGMVDVLHDSGDTMDHADVSASTGLRTGNTSSRVRRSLFA